VRQRTDDTGFFARTGLIRAAHRGRAIVLSPAIVPAISMIGARPPKLPQPTGDPSPPGFLVSRIESYARGQGLRARGLDPAFPGLVPS